MLRQVQCKSAFVGRPVTIVLLMIVAFVALGFGQVTSGTIFGSVKDPSGAIVPGARVTVTNPGNGLVRVVQSGENGEFVVPNLLPGTYTIAVSAQGFTTLQKTDIVLSGADRLNAGEFVLAVGATTESVKVTADAGQLQLQSNSAERSDLITSKQLDDVALDRKEVGLMLLDTLDRLEAVR